MSTGSHSTRTEGRDLADNTLGELRALVAAADGMPDEARWYVRTGMRGGSRHGSRPVGVTVVDDGRAGRT